MEQKEFLYGGDVALPLKNNKDSNDTFDTHESGSERSFSPQRLRVPQEIGKYQPADRLFELERLANRGLLEPRALDLTPCSFEQYLRLSIFGDISYELVNGVLVWRSEMSDSEHGQLSRLLGRLFELLGRKRGNSCEAYGPVSNKVGSSSVRYPDVSISQEGRQLSELSPESKKISFARGKQVPIVNIEITSESNYNVDLTEKWMEYADMGVAEYLILCRSHPVKKRDREKMTHAPCVVVGSLNTTGSCAYNGYPGCTETTCSRGETNVYQKRVFKGNEIVQCSYLSGFHIKADTLLNVSDLKRKVGALEIEYQQKAEAERKARLESDARAKNAEAEKQKAETGKLKAKERAKNAEAGKLKAEERAKNAEAGKQNAEAGKLKAEERAKNAEAGKQNAEAGRKRYRDILKQHGIPVTPSPERKEPSTPSPQRKEPSTSSPTKSPVHRRHKRDDP